MAEVFETKKKKDVTGILIKAVKIYFGIALISVIATVPTKGIYLLINFLWNLI